MIQTFLSVLPVFALIGSGWGVRRLGLLGPAAAREVNRLVVYLALPALLFDIITRTRLTDIWQPGFVAAFSGGAALAYFGGLALAAWRRPGQGGKAIEGLNAGYANTAFIGFPLLAATLGPWTQPLTLIASLLTVSVLFAVSIAGIEIGLSREPQPWRVARKVSLSLLKNPAVVSPIIAAGVSLAGWTVSGPIETYLHLLSAAASPCALLSLGLFLADRPHGSEDKGARERPGLIVALSATKLVAQPVMTFGFCRLLRLPWPATEAAVLIAALPTGTGPYMLAELYGLHAARTAQVILWTTLASLVTVPIVLTLMR